jgi:hypothetical protein
MLGGFGFRPAGANLGCAAGYLGLAGTWRTGGHVRIMAHGPDEKEGRAHTHGPKFTKNLVILCRLPVVIRHSMPKRPAQSRATGKSQYKE